MEKKFKPGQRVKDTRTGRKGEVLYIRPQVKGNMATVLFDDGQVETVKEEFLEPAQTAKQASVQDLIVNELLSSVGFILSNCNEAEGHRVTKKAALELKKLLFKLRPEIDRIKVAHVSGEDVKRSAADLASTVDLIRKMSESLAIYARLLRSGEFSEEVVEQAVKDLEKQIRETGKAIRGTLTRTAQVTLPEANAFLEVASEVLASENAVSYTHLTLPTN